MNDNTELTTDDVAEIPGMDGAVYFVNPGEPIRDWRSNIVDANEDDELTPEELAAVKRMVGFDFDKPVEKNTNVKLKTSPFKKP